MPAHSMGETEELCSRVAVIRLGQLVTVGPPPERRARMGSPGWRSSAGFTEQALAPAVEQAGSVLASAGT